MEHEEKLKKLQEHYKTYNPRSIVSLFYEGNKEPDKAGAIFNTTNEDTDKTFSFRQLYLCYLDDPTEVAFVDAVLNGRYDWLETLKRLLAFKDFYRNLRIEAEQRRIAKNIKAIVSISEDEKDKNRLAALKYLTDNSFNTAESTIKRGRPSKEELEGAKKLALKEMTEDEQDLARLIQ
jgi:hypothetical protein